MSLREYDSKRDFSQTSEPRGKTGSRSGDEPIFVIQLHHATARHFDFRLQIGDALASWAVPKGPSLRPGEKRLAVQVEDHPLDYASFEGVIAEGNYGAGDVRIADHGTWEADGDAEEAVANGKLDFTLHGEKLGGRWKLIRTKGSGKRQQWLLMKRDDAFAADTDLDELVHAAPEEHATPRKAKTATSAKTAKATKTAKSAKTAKATKVAKSVKGEKATDAATASKPGASRWRERALRLPGAVQGAAEPAVQLATLSSKAPTGDDWLHEVKWDGYRLLAARDGDQVRVASRNDVDWTGRFPHIEAALLALPVNGLKLDGELVVLDAQGHSDFAGLQRSLEGTSKARMICMAFDLLQVEDVDITRVPLLERKLLLEALLAKKPSPFLAYSQHVVGNGAEVFAASQQQGLEGIVSKDVSAPYTEGRSKRWLKVKHSDATEAIVVGYTAPQRSRQGVGSLMLAMREGEELRYVGRVGTGMDSETLKALRKKLDLLRRDEPVLKLPSHVALSPRAITWVEPSMVVEVEHRGWGKEGLLRHASFLRERLDKRDAQAKPDGAKPSVPKPTRRTKPEPVKPEPATPETGDPAKARTKSTTAEGRLTSPHRKVFTSPDITKQEVADYYRAVAPFILPGIVDRPLSIVRAPDGVPGELFFQKHAGTGLGQAVKSIAVREKTGRRENYVRIDDVAGLLQLVQMNALEFHPWGVHPDRVEQPDRVVFDLDPGPGVPWKAVLAAARTVQKELQTLSLESFPMVSGGKGLHVVVPLAPRHDWDLVKAFAQAVAKLLEHRAPDKYVATASKEKRDGRIFIDWLRNGRGATSVAAWSLRARPGAPVAMPMRWDELGKLTGGDHFTLATALRRTKALRDHPWGTFRDLRQRLPTPP